MKKILFLMALNFWSISTGKGAPSLFKTVNGYVQAGWDVHVLMREENPNFGSSPENLHIHKFEYPLLRKLAKKRHISTIAQQIGYILSQYRFRREGARIIQAEGIDILYAYEVDGVPAAQWLSRRFRLPFVTRFMGTVLADKLHSLKYKTILRHHFKALRTAADLTIMTNDGTQGKWVLEQLGNQSKDIRFWINGVNRIDLSGYDAEQVRQMLGVPHGAKTLLCVSRLVGWKRLDRSLRAFHRLLSSNSDDLRLVIVGDGEMRSDLERLANELGIAGKTIFTGGLPQAKVYSIMKFSDIFLSLYDLSNMGNPLFEAMRVGKPIVTLNNGDTSTIIEHNSNGLLLEPDSTIETISNHIRLLLDDQELASRLARQAASSAEQIFRTWDERIAEEVEVVASLAKR